MFRPSQFQQVAIGPLRLRRSCQLCLLCWQSASAGRCLHALLIVCTSLSIASGAAQRPQVRPPVRLLCTGLRDCFQPLNKYDVSPQVFHTRDGRAYPACGCKTRAQRVLLASGAANGLINYSSESARDQKSLQNSQQLQPSLLPPHCRRRQCCLDLTSWAPLA